MFQETSLRTSVTSAVNDRDRRGNAGSRGCLVELPLMLRLDELYAVAFAGECTRMSEVQPCAVSALVDILRRTAKALIVRSVYSRRHTLRNNECVNHNNVFGAEILGSMDAAAHFLE